jgi:hypothetical protein
MLSEARIDLISDIENPTNEELEKVFTDKLYRLNSLYSIRDKDGNIIRFRLNPEQTHYIQNRHHRNINLKARQLGFTTLAVIDALDDCLFNEYFNAGIIADDLDNAAKIFDKAKLAFEFLPEWLKKWRIPTTDKVGEYRFPNGSVFSVDTSFRGGTLSRLHVSELGKISVKYPEKAKEIVSGAFEAVPKNGYIDVESTAEGATGKFYDLCRVAMKKAKKELASLEFKFFFYPWWKNPEYEIDADVEFDKELLEYFDYLEKEQDIKLSPRQKNWYALKKESQEELMEQEYPSYAMEAFLASGRPFFNQKLIAAKLKLAEEKEYELKTFTVLDMQDNEHTYDVKIWKHPKKNMAYAVGGDPAEGLEKGDNSALCVLGKDFEQYAAFAGKVDPDLFGGLLVEVAKYFNMAVLSWESNNHGHAVEGSIKRRKYFHLYRREQKEEISEEVKERIGWLNTSKSKMEMLDLFKATFRDGSLVINCEETLGEMLTCVVEHNGNVIINGKDRVASTGIALVALGQAIVPETLGTHETNDNKVRFKSLGEMLKVTSDSSEESYFD